VEGRLDDEHAGRPPLDSWRRPVLAGSADFYISKLGVRSACAQRRWLGGGNPQFPEARGRERENLNAISWDRLDCIAEQIGDMVSMGLIMGPGATDCYRLGFEKWSESNIGVLAGPTYGPLS